MLYSKLIYFIIDGRETVLETERETERERERERERGQQPFKGETATVAATDWTEEQAYQIKLVTEVISMEILHKTCS